MNIYNDNYFDYWEYVLVIKEKYNERQFHEALDNLQPPRSFDKYTMLSYGECIALDDGIGELLELIDDEDFKRKINNLIDKLLIFKKNSLIDEIQQIKYLLHIIDDIIKGDRHFQQDTMQYDICQIGSIVLYVEIISELYAIDFWEIYSEVPHKRIML